MRFLSAGLCLRPAIPSGIAGPNTGCFLEVRQNHCGCLIPKRSGLHDGELGLGRPFIGQFVAPGQEPTQIFGLFGPIAAADLANLLSPTSQLRMPTY